VSRAAAPYDRKAAVYDAIVGRPAYHRVFCFLVVRHAG
jgi:hypothetical protein